MIHNYEFVYYGIIGIVGRYERIFSERNDFDEKSLFKKNG